MKSTTAHFDLQMGHLERADQLIKEVETDSQASPWLKSMNAALRALCFGDLDTAVERFNQTLELEPDNIVLSLSEKFELSPPLTYLLGFE
jgi:predicted Zn-dependent protease